MIRYDIGDISEELEDKYNNYSLSRSFVVIIIRLCPSHFHFFPFLIMENQLVDDKIYVELTDVLITNR